MVQNLLSTRAGTIDREAKTFCREKKGGEDFLREKRWTKIFFQKTVAGEDFFYYNILKIKIQFSK